MVLLIQKRMRLDSSGNLGLGTSSPQAHLDINTEAAETTAVIINGEANQDKIIKIRHYGNSEAAGDGFAGFIGSVVDNVLTLGHFNSSNTEVQALHITEAGNVGIGTSSPSSRLHIDGAEDSTGGITLTAGAQAHDWFLSSDFVNVHNIGTGSASAAHTWQFNGTETVRFTPSGVGIGTTSPSKILHLKGSAAQIRIEDSDGTNQIADIASDSGDMFL